MAIQQTKSSQKFSLRLVGLSSLVHRRINEAVPWSETAGNSARCCPSPLAAWQALAGEAHLVQGLSWFALLGLGVSAL